LRFNHRARIHYGFQLAAAHFVLLAEISFFRVCANTAVSHIPVAQILGRDKRIA
jgi:hypothetical protein